MDFAMDNPDKLPNVLKSNFIQTARFCQTHRSVLGGTSCGQFREGIRCVKQGASGWTLCTRRRPANAAQLLRDAYM